MKIRSTIVLLLLVAFSYANYFAQTKDDGKKAVEALIQEAGVGGVLNEVQNKRIEEWEKRINEERQPPEKVMDAIGVKRGMIIGEVGAGRGRYTVHLARRVGKEGKIYANDINENALSYLRERCQLNNIQNIETILGKVDDPLFPEKSLDMAIMVWVYHMLEQPVPLLKNLKPSLKPGATLVILDPPDEEIDEEIKELKGKLDPNRPTIKERIENEGAEAGFEIVRIETFLPKDIIYILRIKSTGKDDV